MPSGPDGLEDVSKYPNLVRFTILLDVLITYTRLGLLQFVELYQRGWSRKELEGLASANLLRVMQGAERTARELAREGAQPEYELYDRRTDIPVHD